MRQLTTVLLSLFTVITLANPISATAFDQVTEVGSSARMIGIGNIEGFDTTAAAVFENPAALGHINRASISAFYTTFLDGDVSYMSYAGALRTQYGVFSLGMMSVSTPESHITEVNNDVFESIGTFDYENSVLKLGYQVNFNYWTYIGVAANYFSHKIGDVDGTAFDADVGLYTKINQYEISLVAKHLLGSSISYSDGSSESAPRQYIAGVKTDAPWMDDLELFGQFKYATREDAMLFAVGTRWVPFGMDLFAVSAGWQQYLVLSETKSKLSIGLVLDLDSVSFNFSFEESEFYNQDYQYYFSTSVDF